jgi:hypothetical protein
MAPPKLDAAWVLLVVVVLTVACYHKESPLWVAGHFGFGFGIVAATVLQALACSKGSRRMPGV